MQILPAALADLRMALVHQISRTGELIVSKRPAKNCRWKDADTNATANASLVRAILSRAHARHNGIAGLAIGDALTDRGSVGSFTPTDDVDRPVAAVRAAETAVGFPRCTENVLALAIHGAGRQ